MYHKGIWSNQDRISVSERQVYTRTDGDGKSNNGDNNNYNDYDDNNNINNNNVIGYVTLFVFFMLTRRDNHMID